MNEVYSMKKIKLKFVDCWFSDYQKSVPMGNLISLLSTKYQIEFSDDPDFIICSCFGTQAHAYKACKIFFSGENVIPDFNLYDYGIGFSRIVFGDRYIRIPLYALYNNDFNAAISKHVLPQSQRDKFCAMVVSNGGNANSRRTEIFNELSRYKLVDSGGRYLNNVGGPVKDKRVFLNSYKFSIAFENSSFPDYTTEKIVQAWAAGTLPVYWGDPNIVCEFNPKSFINCNGKSIEQIVQEIIYIDQNDELYHEMMESPILGSNGEFKCAEYVSQDKLLDFFSNIFDKGPHRRVSLEGSSSVYVRRAIKLSKVENSFVGKLAKKIL